MSYRNVPARRLDHFNYAYRCLLDELSIAFPYEQTPSLVDRFNEQIKVDNALVYGLFDRFLDANMDMIIADVSSMNTLERICDAHWARDPNALLAKLPYLDELPLSKWWTLQIVENEHNAMRVIHLIAAVLVARFGLPPIVNADTVERLFNLVSSVTDKHGVTGSDMEHLQTIATQSIGAANGAVGVEHCAQVVSSSPSPVQSAIEDFTTDPFIAELIKSLSEDTYLDFDLTRRVLEKVGAPYELILMLDMTAINSVPIM